MSFYIALWLGKIVNAMINIIDKNRGSDYTGKIARKICPKFLLGFKDIDYEKVLFITGTNGKSSTNNLVNHLLKSGGKTVVSNLEGANLMTGIMTAFIKAASVTGKIKTDFFVFEVDERYLRAIHEQFPAGNILVTNIQKDQVQRNGDPDFIYRKLFPICKKNVRLFLNNDEPRALSFSSHNKNYVTYGVSKHSEAFTKDKSFPSMPCPVCGHSIRFRYFNNDNVGKFQCTGCDYKSNEAADYQVEEADFDEQKFMLKGISFNMPYSVPFMVYNYAAAIAAAKEFAGIRIEDMVSAFDNFQNIGGRYEALTYKSKTIKYIRMKQENPDTFQTSINNITHDTSEKMICLGLGPITDITPHYTNTFYTYDCDLARLADCNAEKYLCFSEPVCYDVTNRLIYAGVPPEKITTIPTDDIDTLLHEIDKTHTDNIYLITLLKTFDAIKQKLSG